MVDLATLMVTGGNSEYSLKLRQTLSFSLRNRTTDISVYNTTKETHIVLMKKEVNKLPFFSSCNKQTQSDFMLC